MQTSGDSSSSELINCTCGLLHQRRDAFKSADHYLVPDRYDATVTWVQQLLRRGARNAFEYDVLLIVFGINECPHYRLHGVAE